MMNGIIIKITDKNIVIGFENGTAKEFPIENLNFEPYINAQVLIFDDIITLAQNSKRRKSHTRVRFNNTLLITKINISLLFLVFLIAIIYFTFSVVQHGKIYFEDLFNLFFLVAIVFSVLNLFYLLITLFRKKLKDRNATMVYLIISLLSFIATLIIALIIVSDKDVFPMRKVTTESSSQIKTSDYEETTSASEEENDVDKLSEIDVDDDKSHYTNVDYDAWNHDEIENGTKIKINGKVLQELEEDGSHLLRVSINDDYDKIVLVVISDSHYDRVIAEGDQITLYGLSTGRQSYTTVFNSSKTLPSMVALMYEN